MTTRLAAAVVGVSLVSLLVATIVGLTAGRDLGNDLFEGRLVAMSASSSSDARGHMTSLQNTAAALASSPQAVAALDTFADAHAELLTAPGDMGLSTGGVATGMLQRGNLTFAAWGEPVRRALAIGALFTSDEVVLDATTADAASAALWDLAPTAGLNELDGATVGLFALLRRSESAEATKP